MTKFSRLSLAFFSLALLLQAGILVSFQFSKQASVDSGRKIIVPAVPVDPRDLFRGDYVTLRYPFSTVARKIGPVSFGQRVRRGAELYVKLHAAGPAGTSATAQADWQVASLSRRPFSDLVAEDVMLAGTVETENASELRVLYGCESFYVPEGRGKPIEKSVREHRVTVELSVTPRGEALARKLFIDNQEVKFSK